MFAVYYGGGLGNKMFEYAYAAALHQEYPDTPICFFDTLKNVVWYRSVDLETVFTTTLPIREISSLQYRKMTGRYAPFFVFRYLNPASTRDYTKIWYKIDEQINCNSERRKEGRIINRGFYYVPLPEFDLRYDYFFDGPWLNFQYFDKYRDVIQREFTFRHVYPKEKISELQNCNSVAVHVRRGDHVTVSQRSKRTYDCDLCGIDYYKRAIKILEEKVEDPVFYFFSDDHAYIQENFKEIRKKKFIRSKRDFLDMQLMTLCRHAVIANSTFSFWGAYLNQNKDKVVAAPRYYEIRNGRRVEMAYPKEWISLEV